MKLLKNLLGILAWRLSRIYMRWRDPVAYRFTMEIGMHAIMLARAGWSVDEIMATIEIGGVSDASREKLMAATRDLVANLVEHHREKTLKAAA